MQDLNEIINYFEPIKLDLSDIKMLSGSNNRMTQIDLHTVAYQSNTNKVYDIAILGVNEERNSSNIGTALAPDIIREKLYSLFKPKSNIRIIDLGNIKLCEKISDSYSAVQQITQFLIENKILPIIIGGSQDLTFPVYKAYKSTFANINFVSIDAKIDLSEASEGIQDFDSSCYLNSILSDKSNFLFSFTHLAHQSYFVSQNTLDYMSANLYETIRLGDLREDIREAEPVLRDADFVSFDICSIKQSYAPGNNSPSPNGLSGEEACQLAKYAGLSDRLSCFGLFEVNPSYDLQNQTSHLAAQIIWHFIDGFYSRKNDYPLADLSEYKKFIVQLTELRQELVFYKSPLSDRWWIEIPCFISGKSDKLIISCSYADYQKACEQEIPQIWLKSFQKIQKHGDVLE